MNKYEVRARHSPCPVKLLEGVEAHDQAEALAEFVKANIADAQTSRRMKSEPKLVTQVEAWVASGCPGVSVRLVEGVEPVEVAEEKTVKKPAKKAGAKVLPADDAGDPTTLQE